VSHLAVRENAEILGFYYSLFLKFSYILWKTGFCGSVFLRLHICICIIYSFWNRKYKPIFLWNCLLEWKWM